MKLTTTSRSASNVSAGAPLARAVYYFDVFVGEVCNDGLSQYFFNQAGSLPDFANAADIVAVHPGLEDIVALMREAQGRWPAEQDDVRAASALTHSLRSRAIALTCCCASILSNSGCGLCLDRCTRADST
jgi:hypothetical protein